MRISRIGSMLWRFICCRFATGVRTSRFWWTTSCERSRENATRRSAEFDRARDLLSRYDWPGNIRELENVIHRGVVLATGVVLQLQDFPLEVAMPHAGARLTEDTGLPLKDACDQFERQYVLRVLDRVQWNVSESLR